MQSLRVGQWSGKGGLGYEITANLDQLGGSFVKSVDLGLDPLKEIEHVTLEAHLNALGATVDRFSIRGKGLDALAAGSIPGNLQNPSRGGLRFDSQLKVDTDVGTLIKAIEPGFVADGFGRKSTGA